MPGEQVVKCAECGVTTRYRDMKYIGGVLVLNHKLDCSQQYLAYPALYLRHQAENPSQHSED